VSDTRELFRETDEATGTRTGTSQGPAASEEADADVRCSLTLWSTGSRTQNGSLFRKCRRGGPEPVSDRF
jgi:hypothetical protein